MPRTINEVEQVVLTAAIRQQHSKSAGFKAHFTADFILAVVCEFELAFRIPLILASRWQVSLLVDHIAEEGLSRVEMTDDGHVSD